MTLNSFGQDVRHIRGLTRKSSDRLAFFFALVLILTLKEKRKYKSEKEFESEVKRKSAVTFVTALFFLVAGTGLEPMTFGL